jgi:hypothetical protein
MNPWIQYTLARLGFFLVPMVILLWAGTGWLLSAVFASLIALALSVLFLNGLRSRLSTEITTRVTKPTKDVDSDVEDSQIESAKD